MKHLSEVEGLELGKTHQLGNARSTKAWFKQDANQVSVTALLNKLPSDYELTFFDPSHPTYSDPGAYISVAKVEGEFAIKAGNHGWSSSWVKIELSQIEKYLEICRPNNTGENWPESANMLLYRPVNRNHEYEPPNKSRLLAYVAVRTDAPGT